MDGRRLWKRIKRDYGPYLPLSPYLFVVLFPFYWMIVTSLKHDKEIYGYEATLIPEKPTIANYLTVFKDTPYLLYLRNSVVVALSSTLLSIIIACLGAYAIARLNFPGRTLLARGLVCTYLVPPSLLFIPLSQVVRGLGFIDSVWALVIVYPSFTLPFCTWLLMGFVRTVPREIEESAQIDGCTRFQAFRMIIIPVIVPGIITAGIFAFTLTYQEFIYALTFISSSANKTISYGVTSDLIRGDVYYWGSLMAGALIGAIPVAVVYAFSLDHFIHGLTAGALK